MVQTMKLIWKRKLLLMKPVSLSQFCFDCLKQLFFFFSTFLLTLHFQDFFVSISYSISTFFPCTFFSFHLCFTQFRSFLILSVHEWKLDGKNADAHVEWLNRRLRIKYAEHMLKDRCMIKFFKCFILVYVWKVISNDK